MKKGFTLVELLIVIIIIGILATMAIPQYNKMVGRAKWIEAVTIVSQIKTAENLYKAENTGWTLAGAVLNSTASPLSQYIDTTSITGNTKWAFTIKTAGSIYAASEIAKDDDWAGGPGTSPYYEYNLDADTGTYGNGAPGAM